MSLPLALVLGGCGAGPCGNGMKPDDRPLEGALAEIGTPSGATMCMDAESPAGQPATNRGFAFAAGAGEQALSAWKALLESKGYTDATDPDQVLKNAEAAAKPGNCATKHAFTHDSKPALQLVIAACREPVWSTITVRSD